MILKALQEQGADNPDNFFKKVNLVATSVEGGKKEEASKVLSELEGYLAPYKRN